MKILKKSIKPVLNANKSRTTDESSKLVRRERRKNKESLFVKRDFLKLMLVSVQRKKIKKRKRHVSRRNLKKLNSKDSTSTPTLPWSSTRHGKSWKKAKSVRSATNKT